MMWGYVQLPDETQFAYSDIREDGTVLMLIERPRDWGFDSARCIPPHISGRTSTGSRKRKSMTLTASYMTTPPSSSNLPSDRAKRGGSHSGIESLKFYC